MGHEGKLFVTSRFVAPVRWFLFFDTERSSSARRRHLHQDLLILLCPSLPNARIDAAVAVFLLGDDDSVDFSLVSNLLASTLAYHHHRASFTSEIRTSRCTLLRFLSPMVAP